MTIDRHAYRIDTNNTGSDLAGETAAAMPRCPSFSVTPIRPTPMSCSPMPNRSYIPHTPRKLAYSYFVFASWHVSNVMRSGYIHGRGTRPKPKTSTVGQRIHAQLERENEEFRRRAEANTRCLELLEKENSQMASQMESLESQLASQQTQVQAQVQAALQSQVELQQT